MRLPIPKFTLLRFMIVVPCLGLCLAEACEIVLNFGGLGTTYSKKYDETKFHGLRAGMTAKDVEAIMGPPLKRVLWNQDMEVHDEEMWYYSDQRNGSANFWRRWVHFDEGKASVIIEDYWCD